MVMEALSVGPVCHQYTGTEETAGTWPGRDFSTGVGRGRSDGEGDPRRVTGVSKNDLELQPGDFWFPSLAAH